MSQSNSSVSFGVGFFPLMFLIFMTLKLCGVIGWSWWLVSAPLWIPFLIGGLFFGCVILSTVIAALIALSVESKKRRRK